MPGLPGMAPFTIIRFSFESILCLFVILSSPRKTKGQKHEAKNKYDDNSSEKTNVHISYSSDSLSNENYKTIKYISGNYHPSEEIKQIVKVNNNNIYNNHSLRDVYHRFEIFKDTPYNIKYLC